MAGQLDNKYGDRDNKPLTGVTTPTTSTPGYLGQVVFDTGGDRWECTKIDGSVYTWTSISSKEDFVLIKRINKSTEGNEVVTLDGNLYDVIKIYVQSSSSTTTLSHLYLTFNGDSGSNYMRQYVLSTGTTMTAGLLTDVNIVLNYNYGIVGSTNSSELIIFPKVTGTNRPIISTKLYNPTLVDLRTLSESYLWKNTASNITTFNIEGFTAGSHHTITILGRKAPV